MESETSDSHTAVIDGLFISDRKFAKDKEALQRLGIRFVVNATVTPELDGGVHNFFENDQSFSYLRCAIADSNCANIAEFFDASFDFITRGIDSGFGVLIHCQQGVSRSASLVLAYLMRAQSLSLKQAYAFLKQKRPVVKPNGNFLRQLVEFEKQLLAKSKVAESSSVTVATSADSHTIKPSTEQFRNRTTSIESAVESKKRSLADDAHIEFASKSDVDISSKRVKGPQMPDVSRRMGPSRPDS